MKSFSYLCSGLVLAGVVFLIGCGGEPKGDGSTAGTEEATETTSTISVLLVDGQNNHSWATTSPVIKEILEESGRFEVTVSTSPEGLPRAPRKAKGKATPESNQKFAEAMKAWEVKVAEIKESSKAAWAEWNPDFSAYDVVVSNYNGEPWPEAVKEAFEAYVKSGGGFVSVHAADNAFPEWKAYNEMIAVGGWGGRSELSGPYLRLRDGQWVEDTTPGRGGSHGKRHEFLVETQVKDHPITRGLPEKWLHAEDELYGQLRGPAKNVTVLASAFSDEATGGSGENEPLLMVIDYGEGRVFHTTLGHDVVAMSDVGFAETLKRGTEWAATGDVTFGEISAAELPADSVALRKPQAAAGSPQ